MLKSLAALTLCALSLSASAMSNEEFAAQVQSQEKKIRADKTYGGEVLNLCESLGAQRRQEEPKCVAIQKIMSTLYTPERQPLGKFKPN